MARPPRSLVPCGAKTLHPSALSPTLNGLVLNGSGVETRPDGQNKRAVVGGRRESPRAGKNVVLKRGKGRRAEGFAPAYPFSRPKGREGGGARSGGASPKNRPTLPHSRPATYCGAGGAGLNAPRLPLSPVRGEHLAPLLILLFSLFFSFWLSPPLILWSSMLYKLFDFYSVKKKFCTKKNF